MTGNDNMTPLAISPNISLFEWFLVKGKSSPTQER